MPPMPTPSWHRHLFPPPPYLATHTKNLRLLQHARPQSLRPASPIPSMAARDGRVGHG
ncbi:hypothetical protein EJ02DRAFT_511396 [Clathrospora elynae]|uniref:Uncharacterized protein n=1 Tax=Clathrospora elynae TaxID=706981 RepID=A0A6A5SSU4_9PLEO|nr:hypothetical protein EJ02DRAFT_511396 [Clathrospora elynae]